MYEHFMRISLLKWIWLCTAGDETGDCLVERFASLAHKLINSLGRWLKTIDDVHDTFVCSSYSGE